jgi:predicted permease
MLTGIAALRRDLAYSFRMLAKRPGFTVAAVAVLSLGIGANTAIFSLVNAFLLKPLVLRNAQELTGVYSRDTKKPDSYRAFSYPNYADLRTAGGGVFSSLAAHNITMAGVSEGDTTRRIMAEVVSSNYFDTLGAPVWRGRGFTAGEERPGSGVPVAIASYSFWKRSGAPPDFLGRTLKVNGQVVTVVGIMPHGFSGTMALLSPELYLPLGMYERVTADFDGAVRPLAARDNHSLILIGRFRPGQSPQAVKNQLAALAANMEKAFPAENKDQTLTVHPLSRLSISTNPIDDSGLMIPVTMMLCMSGVVLLIAALNVANMMLARGTARRKEIAIRLALGGGRRSIVQQLFLESLVLAVLGGVAGMFLSFGGTALFVGSMVRLLPFDLVIPTSPDVRVLAATLGFCVLSTLVFGFFPAWNLSRPSLVTDLRASDNAQSAAGRGRLFSRGNMLVIAQVSLSLVLLTAAGLFIRSSAYVAGVNPGFRVENRVLAEFDASLAGYDEARGRQVYGALLDRMKSMPGVESAGLAATVPFGMVSLGKNVQPSGATKVKPQNLSFDIVSGDYFQTLGIPLLRGRTFQPADASQKTQPVAILDKYAAQRIWPEGDAVGKHIHIVGEGASDIPDVEVVGIVGDVREHIIGGGVGHVSGGEGDAGGQPHLYVPFGQQYMADMHIHLRTAPMGDDAAVRFLGTVRQEIRAVDSGLPVLGVRTLRAHVEASADYWLMQTGARMFSLFGGIALLLAVIGLYGVRAYSVARRTREIGIRMALGASAAETQKMVLREGVQLMAVGTAIGLVLSFLLGTVLAGLLFHVHGADPLVFSVAVVLLGGVSLVACYVPARRAARIDPMVALRWE